MIDALLKTLTDSKTVTPIRRAAAGRILAQRNLGDPRPEVMTIEAMQFCYVPEGKFWMGSGEEDEQATDREKPLHEIDIAYPYWISRYPISNRQYAAFITAKGYENPAWWNEAQQHDLWRPGEVQNVYYTWDDKKNKLVRHLQGWRKKPVEFADPFNLPNHPVVGINWYEALAFTRWLTQHMHEQAWLPSDWQVQLPNEPEWEKAARGGLQVHRLKPRPLLGKLDRLQDVKLLENKRPQSRYPWGDKTDPNRANSKETKIESTSAMGCFPTSDSPYGVEEMSGNVYEWTRSLWGADVNKVSYGYPYQADDGRENLEPGAEILRILRGGSYFNESRWLRCANRLRFLPNHRNDNYGFRVVLSPFTSGL